MTGPLTASRDTVINCLAVDTQESFDALDHVQHMERFGYDVRTVGSDEVFASDLGAMMTHGNDRGLASDRHLAQNVHDLLAVKVEKVDDEDVGEDLDFLIVDDFGAEGLADQSSRIRDHLHDQLVVPLDRQDIGDDFVTTLFQSIVQAADGRVLGVENGDTCHGWASLWLLLFLGL